MKGISQKKNDKFKFVSTALTNVQVSTTIILLEQKNAILENSTTNEIDERRGSKVPFCSSEKINPRRFSFVSVIIIVSDTKREHRIKKKISVPNFHG